MNNILRIVTSILLFIFLFLLFYKPIEIGDAGIHLSIGKWMIEKGQIPHEDPFSFAEIKEPWINTQWIGSCLFYLIEQWKGNEGLKISLALYFVVILLIFFVQAYGKMPVSVLIPLVMIMAFGLLEQCSLTPTIFNLVFIQVFLIQLFIYKKTSSRMRLLLLPILGIIWANFNIDGIVYGTILISAFLLVLIVELINFKSEKPFDKLRTLSEQSESNGLEKTSLTGNTRQIKDLAVILVLFWLPFTMTPYGLEGLYSVNLDFQGTVQISSFILWFYLLICLDVFAFIGSKKNRFLHVLLILFSLYLLLKDSRTLGFFVLVSGYMIMESASQMSINRIWKFIKGAKLWDTITFILLIIILSVLCFRLFNMRIENEDRIVRMQTLDYAPGSLNQVIRQLHDYGIEGRVFSLDKLGGQILWFGYPEFQPFIDTRHVNNGNLKRYWNVLKFPKENWDPFLNEQKIRIVVLDTSEKSCFRLINHLIKDKKWRLIIVDGSYLVYVHKKYFSLTKKMNNFERQIRAKKIDHEEVKRLIQIDQKSLKLGFREFIEPYDSYIKNQEEAMSLYKLGYRGAGISRLLASQAVLDQPLTRRYIDFILDELGKIGYLSFKFEKN